MASVRRIEPIKLSELSELLICRQMIYELYSGADILLYTVQLLCLHHSI